MHVICSTIRHTPSANDTSSGLDSRNSSKSNFLLEEGPRGPIDARRIEPSNKRLEPSSSAIGSYLALARFYTRLQDGRFTATRGIHITLTSLFPPELGGVRPTRNKPLKRIGSFLEWLHGVQREPSKQGSGQMTGQEGSCGAHVPLVAPPYGPDKHVQCQAGKYVRICRHSTNTNGDSALCTSGQP